MEDLVGVLDLSFFLHMKLVHHDVGRKLDALFTDGFSISPRWKASIGPTSVVSYNLKTAGIVSGYTLNHRCE